MVSIQTHKTVLIDTGLPTLCAVLGFFRAIGFTGRIIGHNHNQNFDIKNK